MTIDIIIPFYNAKAHVLEVFEDNINKIISDSKLNNFRIILVNDGSSETHHLSFIERLSNKEKLDFIYVDCPINLGKGGAIKEGLKKSDKDYAIFYDIDFPFGINALYKMYDKLHLEDADVVIAIRDFSYFKKLPMKRKFISFIVKSFAFVLSRGKIKDSQAGLKGMKKEIVPILLSTESNSFIIDFEFLLKVTQKKLKLDSILVTPNKEIEFSNFSNGTLKNEMVTLFKILFSKTK